MCTCTGYITVTAVFKKFLIDCRLWNHIVWMQIWVYPSTHDKCNLAGNHRAAFKVIVWQKPAIRHVLSVKTLGGHTRTMQFHTSVDAISYFCISVEMTLPKYHTPNGLVQPAHFMFNNSFSLQNIFRQTCLKGNLYWKTNFYIPLKDKWCKLICIK